MAQNVVPPSGGFSHIQLSELEKIFAPSYLRVFVVKTKPQTPIAPRTVTKSHSHLVTRVLRDKKKASMNFQIVIDALTRIVTDIINFIPNLINGLIILLVGMLIARLVRWLIASALRGLRFDPLVERSGITGTLRGLGVKTPLSQVLAQAVFWLLLLSFLITSTRLMGLEAVARLLEQLLLYLPSLMAALIVFLLGGIVAQFVGNLVTTIGTGAGLADAARLGRFVQYLISVFVVVLALGVLGIDTSILVTALTLTIAAFSLAVGLALGLGARSIVQHILAGHYMRQRLSVGQSIAVGQTSGEVTGIGSVNTVVSGEQGSVIIPNSVLLESLVEAPRPPEVPPASL